MPNRSGLSTGKTGGKSGGDPPGPPVTHLGTQLSRQSTLTAFFPLDLINVRKLYAICTFSTKKMPNRSGLRAGKKRENFTGAPPGPPVTLVGIQS